MPTLHRRASIFRRFSELEIPMSLNSILQSSPLCPWCGSAEREPSSNAFSSKSNAYLAAVAQKYGIAAASSHDERPRVPCARDYLLRSLVVSVCQSLLTLLVYSAAKLMKRLASPSVETVFHKSIFGSAWSERGIRKATADKSLRMMFFESWTKEHGSGSNAKMRSRGWHFPA
jgi:hypothetical protein